jgi:hypothetical protein
MNREQCSQTLRAISYSLAVLTVVLGNQSIVAASSGTEGAAFLDIPVGGGPAALGSAYSALAKDAYAPVYNPAGLGFVETNQLAGQHLSYLESIHDEYLAFVHPLSEGKALGISAQYLGTGNITALDDTGASAGTFNSHYGAYSLAYGQMLGEKLALGVTGKVVEAKISDLSAMAYGADVGSLYQATDNLSLSAGVANVGTKLKFINQGDSLPLRTYAGIAYHTKNSCVLTAEGIYSGTGLLSARGGVEWRPLEMFALRAGYRTDTIKENTLLAGFSTGIGFKFWGSELEYAWVPYGDLGSTQYFSLVLKFGIEKAERKKLIQFRSIKAHRTVKNDAGTGTKSRLEEPEFDQLMQLLNDDPDHIASNSKAK